MFERKYQNTLCKEASFIGLGLHSGKPVALTVRPAAPNHGIVFVRTDLATPRNRIPATWDHIVDTRYCTVLGNTAGAVVATVEHLMSALSAAGIDNAEVRCSGAEVPIMDGSAMAFVASFLSVGIRSQSAPRDYYQVHTSVVYREGDRYAALYPADRPAFEVEIDFKHPRIGRQRAVFDGSLKSYQREIASARTFGFESDLQRLRQSGLALGGSMRNAVLVTDNAVRNAEGLRHPKEFVRHKLLDSIGDIALAGVGIRGRYVSYKPGHSLNRGLLDKLNAAERGAGFKFSRSCS